MRLAPALFLLAIPSIASAEPKSITAGVSVGLAHDKLDAMEDANRTLGVWGRLGFSRRISGQLEVMKTETAGENGDIVCVIGPCSFGGTTVRSGTALLVVDLMDSGNFMPVLMAGIGLDRASDSFGGTSSGHHIEGGLGLEYRARGGLTLGVDLRLGGRSIDEQIAPTSFALFAPQGLQAGEYRTGRVTLGIRF